MMVKLRIIEREEYNKLLFYVQRGIVEVDDRPCSTPTVKQWEDISKHSFLNHAESAYEVEMNRLNPNRGRVLKTSETIYL